MKKHDLGTRVCLIPVIDGEIKHELSKANFLLLLDHLVN